MTTETRSPTLLELLANIPASEVHMAMQDAPHDGRDYRQARAALAYILERIRRAGPLPEQRPDDPTACVCPFPRQLCPNCDNPCRACRYARTPSGAGKGMP